MKKGDIIHYTGDMANRSGIFKITDIQPCKWYKQKIDLKEIRGLEFSDDDSDDDLRTFSISPNMISHTGKDRLKRFITKEAYDQHRLDCIRALQENKKNPIVIQR